MNAYDELSEEIISEHFPSQIDDGISGMYEMSGTRVTTDQQCYPCSLPTEPSIDTTQVSFTLELRLMTWKQDSVRIVGLPSANLEEGGLTVYSTYYDSQEPQVYARRDETELTIHLENGWGHIYDGTGTLKDGQLTLHSTFTYRPIKYEYHIQGNRVSE